MTEDIRAEAGETKIEGTQRDYWNSKTGGYAKKGEQVKGVLLRAEADEYKGKPTTNYVLKDAGDGHEIVLPNHAVLNNLMVKVPVGRTVRIVYQGKSEKSSRGRNAPELYDVFMTTDPIQSAPKQVEKPAMADYMKKIHDQLVFSGKVYPDGIPESLVDATVKAAMREFKIDVQQSSTILGALRGEGLIFEPKPGFYKVVV